MASGTAAAAPATDRAPAVRQMSLTRRVSFWAFASLIVLAVVLYVWWGVSFGVWIDNGLYAIVITLVLFGLAGMWLVMPNPPLPTPPPP
jgi:type VI protein secretion system component VasF